MKTLIALSILVLSFQSQAFANDRDALSEQIKIQMEDSRVGERIDLSNLQGSYNGQCANRYYVNSEALYIQNFVDVTGKSAIVPMSTLQFYGDYVLPKELDFLLTPNAQSAAFVAQFVKEGLTGTDNNLGLLRKASDFAFKYPVTLSENETRLTVTTAKVRSCVGEGFCNPPVLQGCEYGRQDGKYVYQNCFKPNEKTVFKKLADGSLISHRTADAIGTPINNYSFYIPAESTYCRWNIQK